MTKSSATSYNKENNTVIILYQFDWAMSFQDICLNIILAVSIRVFQNETNIQISSLSKANHPSLSQRTSFNHLTTWVEQKVE